MRVLLPILLVALLYVNVSFAMNEAFVQHLWNSFKKTHAKVYLSDQHEKERFHIFKKNVELIDKHNAEYGMGMHTYTLGINEYADWSVDEYRERLLGVKMNLTQIRKGSLSTFRRLPTEVKTPESVDWREKDIVTPVKNQGQCGSCWSFSTTGSLEGAHARANDKLVSLSEQQLVDCSGKYGNEGCNGGLMDNAFKYIKENGGIESEQSYPYKAVQGKCRFDKTKVVATCTGYVDVQEGDEQALKDALATVGPVSVAIDATQEKFMLYKHGVFVDDTCTNQEDSLDHGVLVVGYGTDNGMDYWIVKNSWGTTWGEEGYIRMARNKDNMCGIATAASYPLVK